MPGNKWGDYMRDTALDRSQCDTYRNVVKKYKYLTIKK